MVRPKTAPTKKDNVHVWNLFDVPTQPPPLKAKKKDYFQNSEFFFPILHQAPFSLQFLGQFSVEYHDAISLPDPSLKLYFYVSTNPNKCFFYSDARNKEHIIIPVSCYFPFAALHALTTAYFTSVLTDSTTIRIYLHSAQWPSYHHKFSLPTSLPSSNLRTLANALFGTELFNEPETPACLDIEELYRILSDKSLRLVKKAELSSLPETSTHGNSDLHSSFPSFSETSQNEEPIDIIAAHHASLPLSEETQDGAYASSSDENQESKANHPNLGDLSLLLGEKVKAKENQVSENAREIQERISVHFSDSSPEDSPTNQVDGIINLLKEEKDPILPKMELEMRDVQHPHLNPTLRPYQVQAVRWMLNQEYTPKRHVDLSSLFQAVVTPDGSQLYYHKYLGVFLTSPPPGDLTVTGGILADEMGLGKTVELLACLLNHPRPKEECSPLPHLELPVKIEEEETAASPVNNPEHKRPRELEDEEQDTPRPPDKKRATLGSEKKDSAVRNRQKRQSATKVVNYRELLGSDDTDDDEDCNSKRHRVSKKRKSSVKNIPDDISKERPKRRSAARMASLKNSQMDEDSQDEDFLPISSMKRKSKNPNFSDSSSSSSTLSSDEEISKSKRKKPKKTQMRPQDFEGNVSEIVTGSHFECLCGNEFSVSSRKKLKRCCIECNHWHHARCVRYVGGIKKESLLCPTCWVDIYKTKPLRSKATLIVVPDVILNQWISEIRKHVSYPGFRVFVYRRKPRSHQFISPASLLAYDLVVTTYEVLRAEFKYADITHSKNSETRNLRTPKRFMCLPCPLLVVEWWRLCLDEAQMVESISTNTAEMALRLHSVHRWCVSGTPIQRQLNDFYGLLLFLGAAPYSNASWWQAMILRPHNLGNILPLRSLMGHLFWRTAKKDVEDQLGLNPPREEVHWLNFSLVEREFYLHQHRTCTRDFRALMTRLSHWDAPLSSLDHQTIAKIMLPLKKLREACSTPHLSRGHLVNLSSSNNPIKEMLDSLIKKISTECEEAHRQHIASINGIAAIHIMREEYPQAAERYREALTVAEEQKDNVKTDRLQQIHALFNLTQVLEERKDDNSISRTLNDDIFKAKLADLKKDYLSKFQAHMDSSARHLQPLISKVRELASSFDPEVWWLDIFEFVRSHDLEDAMVAKLKKELINRKGIESNTLAHMFRNLTGLSHIVANKLETLASQRKELVEQVEGHNRQPSSAEVAAAMDCHLRPEEGKNLYKCLYCKVIKASFIYEDSLYRSVAKQMAATARKKLDSDDEEADEAHTESGVWAESELEVVLKAILSFGQNAKVPNSILEEGTLHIKLFDALKKEFKVLRKHWGNVSNYVSAIDELDMATTRFRLRRPNEKAESTKKITYIYEPEELEPLMMKHTSDRAEHMVEFKMKIGQYFYLQNLKKADYGKKGGYNTEHCPICLKELGMIWSMLVCGHSFCTECLRSIVQYQPNFCNNLKCPLCRQSCHIANVMQINTAAQKSDSMSNHVVKGHHSTKVEGIIHCLHNILEHEPEAKVIIFTHWKLMVEVLTSALRENDISVTSWFEPQGFNKFKDPESDIQALVLPISYGANGLNITEANHVVLAEPFINLASEQQAIGRIYRIGQARQTVVHRMVVYSTVEERITELLQPHRSKASSSVKAEGATLTLAQLSDLFSE